MWYIFGMPWVQGPLWQWIECFDVSDNSVIVWFLASILLKIWILDDSGDYLRCIVAFWFCRKIVCQVFFKYLWIFLLRGFWTSWKWQIPLSGSCSTLFNIQIPHFLNNSRNIYLEIHYMQIYTWKLSKNFLIFQKAKQKLQEKIMFMFRDAIRYKTSFFINIINRTWHPPPPSCFKNYVANFLRES